MELNLKNCADPKGRVYTNIRVAPIYQNIYTVKALCHNFSV
jgi:hypothetical protein